MSFLVSNAQNKLFIPLVRPFIGTGGGTDDIAGGFAAPPAVDWHCVPANLNVLRGSVAVLSNFVGGRTIQPRLGGVDTGSPLVLPLIQHAIAGDVALIAPPVAVEADLAANKFGASMSSTNVARVAWQMKFDEPFDAWQLIATGFPSSGALGVNGSGTTQHIAPFSYAIQAQADLKTTPWPVPGTFRYALMVTMTNPLVSASPVIEIGIEAAGIETILGTTPPITGANLLNLMLDTTTTVHVDAGDFVQFVARRTDAGGAQIQSGTRFYVSMGFLPD